jgi:phospholipase/lecithinase/hemolysin
MKINIIKTLIVLSIVIPTVVHALVNMGAVGGSVTDEYLAAPTRVETDLAAFSWVEIISLKRANEVNFGEFRSGEAPWPDKRHAGYEYNWAKVGAAAGNEARVQFSLFKLKIDNFFVGSEYLEKQVDNILSSVESGQIELVSIGAGSNDFLYETHRFDLAGNMTRNNVDPDAAFADSVSNSLLAQAARLKAAGAKVLLALVPSFTAGGPADLPTQQSIDITNAALISGAAELGIAIVDMYGFERNADGGVTVGGVTVVGGTAATDADLVPAGTPGAGDCYASGLCAGPTHKTKYAAEDGFHPNTIIQGLIANQVIEIMNSFYGTSITPLTEQEIVSLTGGQ